MRTPEESKQRAAFTYNAAADTFDDLAVEQLRLAERAAVRDANLTFIRDHEIVRLQTNVVYAVATKKE
jgi:hypothetical protein